MPINLDAVLSHAQISEFEPKKPHNELVIVALPTQRDLSRAVGSEEKHATLLYLGENVSDEIVSLVQASIQEFMRTSSFGPFTETVSTVTSLGDKGARVWMIDSNSGLRFMRDRLVKQPAIRALYDGLEQHPNYTPHVTVGYAAEGQSSLSEFEETQARVVSRITFDRIALWNGDNHDLVWRLPSRSEDAGVAHTDNVSGFLAHYGIKGMRWGIRRNRGPGGTVSSGTKSTDDDQPGGGSGAKSSGGKGSGGEKLSADAQRFASFLGKKPQEMSDAEIKDANKRAEAIKRYNELFGPNPNKEMEQKVQALRLEKEYKNLYAELHPSALARVSRLVRSAAPGYKDVQKMLSSKAGKKIRKSLTDALADAWAVNNPGAPRSARPTSSRRSRKSRRPYAAPTSGATRVTAEQYTPTYNITSLDSAARPLELPRGS